MSVANANFLFSYFLLWRSIPTPVFKFKIFVLPVKMLIIDH